MCIRDREYSDVTDELVKISMYKPIMGILKNTEDSIFTIESAFHSANNISFGDGPFSIKKYINKRVKQTDLATFICERTTELLNVSLSCGLCHHCLRVV